MVSGPRLSSTLARLSPGASQQFDLLGEPSGEVRWLVNGFPGGTPKLGTIDEAGLYMAPGKPSRTEAIIEAIITETRRLWATIIIDTRRDSYRYMGSWNRKGENLTEAHGIGLEPSANLLIADPQQSRVLRFTPEGDYLGEIGNGRGTEPGFFDGPRDVTTDPEGNIYVADGNNCRLQTFDPDDKFLSCVGRKGSGDCEFMRPHSLDIGPDGCIYVIDVDNNRVTIHEKSGELLNSWGREGKKPGEFWAPHGIAVDPNGDVFVIDYYGRCQKFTCDGELLFVFANPSKKLHPVVSPRAGAVSMDPGNHTHGYYRYHAMASDLWGNVYLMARNTLKNRAGHDLVCGRRSGMSEEVGDPPALREELWPACTVDKYNNSGDLVTRITLPPEARRKMGGQGAVVSPEGRIYVSDTGPKHAGVMIFDPI